jgi:hypothetical protein
VFGNEIEYHYVPDVAAMIYTACRRFHMGILVFEVLKG